MPIRFRRSIKLLPGVRLNVSKTGISTSVGPRGLSVNFRGGKRRITTGIPGTGLSQSAEIDASRPSGSRYSGWIALVALFALIYWLA